MTEAQPTTGHFGVSCSAWGPKNHGRKSSDRFKTKRARAYKSKTRALLPRPRKREGDRKRARRGFRSPHPLPPPLPPLPPLSFLRRIPGGSDSPSPFPIPSHSASFASPLLELSFDPLRGRNLAAFANSRSKSFRVVRSSGVGYTLNVLSPFRIFFGILLDFTVS